jgi:hypothetical protein
VKKIREDELKRHQKKEHGEVTHYRVVVENNPKIEKSKKETDEVVLKKMSKFEGDKEEEKEEEGSKKEEKVLEAKENMKEDDKTEEYSKKRKVEDEGKAKKKVRFEEKEKKGGEKRKSNEKKILKEKVNETEERKEVKNTGNEKKNEPAEKENKENADPEDWKKGIPIDVLNFDPHVHVPGTRQGRFRYMSFLRGMREKLRKAEDDIRVLLTTGDVEVQRMKRHLEEERNRRV